MVETHAAAETIGGSDNTMSLLLSRPTLALVAFAASNT